MASSSVGPSGNRNAVTSVQLEGLVALKIINHCEEESDDGVDQVQGVLLGLVVEQKLEITNCFPIPRSSTEDDLDNMTYQVDMMRNLRHVNVDHLHVGWYQSTLYGSYINRTLLDSQFIYQSQIDESVVLIYDPVRTTKDQLSLRAYRLSDELMEMKKSEDFSMEKIASKGVRFDSMFVEIPVVVKNSHLINVSLCQMEEKLASQSNAHQFNNLDMASGNVTENYMRLLMDTVDDLSQDNNKYVHYQKTYSKYQHAKKEQLMKRHLENQKRIAQGEDPLGDEDIHRNFKPPPPLPRLDALLWSSQINAYANDLMQFASHNFGKLFIADALHPDQNTSTSNALPQ